MATHKKDDCNKWEDWLLLDTFLRNEVSLCVMYLYLVHNVNSQVPKFPDTQAQTESVLFFSHFVQVWVRVRICDFVSNECIAKVEKGVELMNSKQKQMFCDNNCNWFVLFSKNQNKCEMRNSNWSHAHCTIALDGCRECCIFLFFHSAYDFSLILIAADKIFSAFKISETFEYFLSTTSPHSEQKWNALLLLMSQNLMISVKTSFA